MGFRICSIHAICSSIPFSEGYSTSPANKAVQNGETLTTAFLIAIDSELHELIHRLEVSHSRERGSRSAMQTDLQVLGDRISRLETLLGTEGSEQSQCIHVRANDALQKLRTQVPDEMAAARRAVAMLAYATPGLRGLAATRRARVARAEAVVNRAAIGLNDIDALLEGMEFPGNNLQKIRENATELSRLERVIVCDAQPAVEDVERRLDELLVDFNDATARINNQILALAGTLKEMDDADISSLTQNT